MVESTRDMCGSVRVRGKNPENVWLNNDVKAAVRRKVVLAASDEVGKERCMEVYRKC